MKAKLVKKTGKKPIGKVRAKKKTYKPSRPRAKYA